MGSQPGTVRHTPPVLPLSTLESQLEQTISKIWSHTTWKQYSSLWRRFLLFIELTGEDELSVGDHAAALFVCALEVSIQTKHTYARNFITIFRKLGWPHVELSLLDLAMKSQGALIPMHQARPMTKRDVDLIFRSIERPYNFLVLLAWKTASRWDEITRLTKESFLPTDRMDEILIYFGTDTKTSKGKPFRPDMYAVIRGEHTDTLRSFLNPYLRQARANEPLFPFPTAKIRDILEAWNFSAHSMKRGAILHLLHVLPEGSPHLHLLPLLAKHAPHHPVLQDLEIRYGSEHQAGIARHLGTGILTSLL